MLEVTPAAVSDMLKRLAEDGFIQYAPYKGVRLTQKGQSVGQNMLRRHRIWELFLHQQVGLPWNSVHQEAEQLEHASSDGLINRLDELLGFPSFDPHGDPIPSKEGVFPDVSAHIPLSQCFIGATVKVVRVNDSRNDFLDYLDSIGIGLNTVLDIKGIHGFDHSYVVSCNGSNVTLSLFAAQQLFVTEFKGE